MPPQLRIHIPRSGIGRAVSCAWGAASDAGCRHLLQDGCRHHALRIAMSRDDRRHDRMAVGMPLHTPGTPLAKAHSTVERCSARAAAIVGQPFGKRIATRARERASRERASMARYGTKAAQKVKRALHERKRGQLKSGRSGKTVTSRKQAIAIGLSEARRAGGKVPRKPTGRSTSRRKHAASRGVS